MSLLLRLPRIIDEPRASQHAACCVVCSRHFPHAPCASARASCCLFSGKTVKCAWVGASCARPRLHVAPALQHS